MPEETSSSRIPGLADSAGPQYLLAILRIVVGWHFLYEGWIKLISPGWTSAPFLRFSTGPLSGFFHWLGWNDTLVRISDQCNIWGLTLVGLALMLGIAVRPAAAGGAILLSLYYFAYPPLFSPAPGAAEGSYLIVNKNMVEFFALAVIMAFPAVSFGLDAFLRKKEEGGGFRPLPRREMIAACAGAPFVGALILAALRKHGWKSFEEINLKGRASDSALASPTMKNFQFATVRDLKGRLPQAKIGNLALSRMILGGNLIGGWAHSRDLVYVSKLVKAYHTRNRIFETFELAETCGVNTVLTAPVLSGVINDYWRSGGKIQFISDCGGGKNVLETIQRSIDNGASACYVHGGIADQLVEQGKFDIIAQGLELIRRNKMPAGIGGHKLETIKGCVEKGLHPDFWMKTLHRVDYWSAKQPSSWAGMDWSKTDNIWCESPEEVTTYMHSLPEPWLAYKILAAGAIDPKVGFRYAFEKGADFICVGMYDFQIVEDVNLALEVLNSRIERQRVWRA